MGKIILLTTAGVTISAVFYKLMDSMIGYYSGLLIFAVLALYLIIEYCIFVLMQVAAEDDKRKE